MHQAWRSAQVKTATQRCVPPQGPTGDNVAGAVPAWLFPSAAPESEISFLPFSVRSWSLLGTHRKGPRSPRGWWQTFIIPHFCSVSRSQRTRLVENVNQIGASRQSGLPHRWARHLCHGVGEISSPGERLQSRFQSQFPAELCVLHS